jgi:nitrile hydratase accessory protein
MSQCSLPSDIPELALEGLGSPMPFSAPWEAQAFAMAVMLNDRGVFSWSEWAQALSVEIHKAQRLGDADDGRTYYRHWLNALEKLVVAKGVTSLGMLGVLRDQWDVAARETPHGEPMLLTA